MELNDEVSIQKPDDDFQSNFPTINIYNKLKLLNDKIIYICGKMHNHTSLAKYDFNACDFYLFIPEDNKLYHSSMNSQDCFTNSFKWNYKYFSKVRECLTNKKINLKKYYFTINELSVNLDISNKDECLELESNINNKYLELHFLVKEKDIVAFRLLLEEIIQNEPYNFFIKQVIILDNEYEEKYFLKEKKQYVQKKEISDISMSIKNETEKFENNVKEAFIKFNKLNNAKIKNSKILGKQLKNN